MLLICPVAYSDIVCLLESVFESVVAAMQQWCGGLWYLQAAGMVALCNCR
jgi:hypothetical protein